MTNYTKGDSSDCVTFLNVLTLGLPTTESTNTDLEKYRQWHASTPSLDTSETLMALRGWQIRRGLQPTRRPGKHRKVPPLVVVQLVDDSE